MPFPVSARLAAPRAAALTAALALTCAAPVLAQQPIRIDTAAGPVDIAAPPARVAVMDIPAIDSLTALGVAPAGAPDRLYVDYLDPVAAATPDIGTLFEPDLEALAALDPDLIIVGGRSVAQKEALTQIAPVIDMTIGADVVGDAKARLAAYGTLFGKTDEAARLTADLDARLAALAKAGEGKGSALVVLTNGPKMSAYGKGSRFGWIFDASGLSEAAPGLKVDTHGASISHEFIAQTNPDWLFVIDRGTAVGESGNSAQATLDTPLVAGTTAWKNDHVVYLDPTPLYIAGGGYTSMTRTLDQLTEALSQ